MKSNGKLTVAVLYGGRSAEHEISIQSAKNVIQYLDTDKFNVLPLGISQQGQWFIGHDYLNQALSNKVLSVNDQHTPHFNPKWLNHGLPASPDSGSSHSIDVIFPAVHGSFCEDGCLQGLLELVDLPYVGAGVLGSSVGMDKEMSKRLAKEAGIPVAPFVVVKQAQWQSCPADCLQKINDQLTYPLFVKPANTGSSVGISKVKQFDQLNAAIEEALRFDRKIIIENGLDVVELEIAVLEALQAGHPPKVSVAGEVKPSHEFYSYDAKYTDDKGAELIIPASVAEEVKQQACEMAGQIFQTLDCEGMARVDMFYDKQSRQVYFNEINTLPGFTKISMYPKLMAASGLEYTDLLTHLIELSLKRHQEKQLLQRCYQQTIKEKLPSEV